METYCWVNSPVRRLPTGLKMAIAFLGVALTALLPLFCWPWFVGWLCVLLAAMGVSRIPAKVWVKRVLYLEPFALGIGVLSLFQPGGWVVFAGILLRSTLSLMTMLLLSHTTPFVEILRVMRWARVPGLLVSTLALMYRYLYVLAEELARMQRARACRTFRQSPPSLWKSAALMAGQLFVRSTERAERIYAAMCSRGWKS
jgi:cobalt/nickel transport system permease protein